VAKPTEKPAPPKARGSLATRLFLVSGAVVALALATAVLATSFVGHRVAENFLRAQLERASDVQSRLGAAELDALNLRALAVSGDPNFVAYLVEAIASNDPLSLTDQLDERQRDLGFTFAIVLDPQGRIVVRTDQQGGDPDMADEAIFKSAAESSEAAADGLWARDGKLYYAVVVPLSSAGVLQGYLLVAYQVDNATAARLSSSTATQVVFLLGVPPGGYQVAATSIDGEIGKELPALVAAAPELKGKYEEPRQVEAELGGRRFRIQAKPIYGIGEVEIGKVLNLGSMEEALEPFVKIQRALMLVGLLAVVVALVASFFVARNLLQPIRELAVAADKAAGGEFNQSIDGSAGGVEVDQLASTFNTLLSELREKRDMQVYLSELSRTLPDQVEGVAVSSEPAQQRSGTLLAFELRGYARTIAAEVPARVTLERLAKDLRRLTQPIAAGGGNIEATVGHRVIASFEGPKKTERALSAAADIVAHGKELDTAVVLATGALVSGSVTWQTKPSFGLIGEVVDAVENLLRVARPGVLLMSRSSRYELSQVPALARLPIQEHKSSISEQPLYSLPAEAAQLLASPELGATQEMTVDGTTSNRTTPWGTMSMTLSGIGPGSVLGDRFEIVSQLGVGGMGVVYKARDRKLHELVALKMLKHDAYSDEQSLEKLKDELKLARKISHPNVLRTFDFGEAEGFPFISMEFVRGVTLKKLLDESGRLPLSAGLHIARQLCRGLQAAHAQAVLHRDIKPENMIIEATGNTKLMDFGIAQPIQRQRAGQSRDGSVVGTPYYLAPEQIEGTEPDVRADIYATGVVLFEIFTGELPFPATGSLMQIITRKLNEEPFKPGIFWGDIPKDLERLIMRCLERDREKRFANVSLLLKELEALRA
jgi:class 3 adenylate cyclase/tRNA A-37 threonylcarbamoyl transferase component Bud32